MVVVVSCCEDSLFFGGGFSVEKKLELLGRWMKILSNSRADSRWRTVTGRNFVDKNVCKITIVEVLRNRQRLDLRWKRQISNVNHLSVKFHVTVGLSHLMLNNSWSDLVRQSDNSCKCLNPYVLANLITAWPCCSTYGVMSSSPPPEYVSSAGSACEERPSDPPGWGEGRWRGVENQADVIRPEQFST